MEGIAGSTKGRGVGGLKRWKSRGGRRGVGGHSRNWWQGRALTSHSILTFNAAATMLHDRHPSADLRLS